MRIGITYDLKSDYLKEGYSLEDVAEFDCEETIEGIERGIEKRGYFPDRIGNIKALVERLSRGERWDLVFNIAEGMEGLGREAQIPALLEAYKIPFTFSGSDLMAMTLNKAVTDAVVRSYGIPAAEFFLVKSTDDLSRMPLPYPVFVKPVAEGTSKGISDRSCVFNVAELEDVCLDLLERFRQPVLVETYLPGREFTVGLIGTGDNARIVGVAEIILGTRADQHAYTYDNKQMYEERVRYILVEEPEVASVALKAWKALECRDAGRIDIRMDDQGKPRFIEVNPLAGLNPSYSDLPILCRMAGLGYEELIAEIIFSASERITDRSNSLIRVA